MRETMRGYPSRVSPFHRRRSCFFVLFFFLRVFLGVFVCVWVPGFVACLVVGVFVAFHDVEILLVVYEFERPSELSWRAGHGGNKTYVYFDIISRLLFIYLLKHTCPKTFSVW